MIYVGFFRNFLLMASFLGIGLGILWGRSGRTAPLSIFGPLLLAVAVIIISGRISIQFESPGEIFFGCLSEATSADVNFLVLSALVGAHRVRSWRVSPSRSVGCSSRCRRCGRTRGTSPGRMAGIAAFTVLSGLGTPPVVWFSVLAVLLVLGGLAAGIRATSLVTAATIAATILVVIVGREAEPVLVALLPDRPVRGGRASRRSTSTASRTRRCGRSTWPSRSPLYTQVYDWFPDRTFDNVLIVGAGSGTDVAVALEKGAGTSTRSRSTR